MKPDLLDIHDLLARVGFEIAGAEWLKLESYFSGVAFGFILAIVLMYRWAKRSEIDAAQIVDLWILMIIMGVFGARILSVLADGHFWDYVHLCTDPLEVDWPLTKAQCLDGPYDGMWDPVERVCHPAYVDCLAWAKFWKGGLTFYGGFILASVTGVLFLLKVKLPVLRVVDSAGWAIPLGLAWGRIGCFGNGCCFGKETDSVLGVVFPAASQASRKQFEEGLLPAIGTESLPVHPTQLYEAIISISIAAFCYLWVERNKRFHGQVFLTFVILYAIGRFVEEFFRNDDRGVYLGLSTSQIIGLLTAAAGGALLLWILRRTRRAGTGRREEDRESTI
jgi:phosphatidylglycerol:prolipoprotein diacylglycerol transferase